MLFRKGYLCSSISNGYFVYSVHGLSERASHLFLKKRLLCSNKGRASYGKSAGACNAVLGVI